MTSAGFRGIGLSGSSTVAVVTSVLGDTAAHYDVAVGPKGTYLVATPAPSVTAVSVTSGIGMTTALGLVASVLD
ncbi:hypothetical protein GCM10027568_22700 [Humibacter soli]